MTDAGFVEGRNVAFDFRWGDGDVRRLPGFATELVMRRVAVIVTTSEPGALAAMQATRTIPIVFNYISDPVSKGLVQSIANPGGNSTGIADSDAESMELKRLQLLRGIVPTTLRIGYLTAGHDAASRRDAIHSVMAAGKALAVEVVLLVANQEEEIDAAFATAKQQDIGAVLVQSPTTFLYAQQKRILEAAKRFKLPVASGNADFAKDGGLMQYNIASGEVPYLTANYVSRILRGQSPAELPVQQATKTNLILNLKTAKVLGLPLPATLLASADDVVE